MITSCIAIIFGFRFFGRGLHEISGEEMAIIAFFMLFLFVPCLWLVRYLKDDEIDSNRQDKLVEIHIDHRSDCCGWCLFPDVRTCQ